MKSPASTNVLGYLLSVFIVGLAVGATIGYTVAKRAPAKLPSEKKFEDGWLAKYQSELSLTEEQVQAVRPMLPDAVEQLGGTWFRAIMTMGAIQESVDRQIEPLLNEAQRQKLIALIKASREKRLRIAGAKFDQQSGMPEDIWYAAAVGDLEVIRRHLQNGEDVNRQDLAFGMTPLSVAAAHGQPEAVTLLLESGADVNVKHPDGNTALHAAAFFGRVECVSRLLAAGADIHARNGEGETPWDSSRTADWETIQFIGALLQVELQKEKVLAGRHAVAELLSEHEQ